MSEPVESRPLPVRPVMGTIGGLGGAILGGLFAGPLGVFVGCAFGAFLGASVGDAEVVDEEELDGY